MSFRADGLLKELASLASVKNEEAKLLNAALSLHCPALRDLSFHIGAKASLLLILGFGGQQVSIPTLEEFQRLVKIIEVAKSIKEGKHLGWLKLRYGKGTVEAAISLLETAGGSLKTTGSSTP